MDRDEFLRRARTRLSGVPVPTLPERLPPTFASGDGRGFDRFAEEIERVGGQARRVLPETLAEAVAEIAAGARTAVVATGLASFREPVVAGLAEAGCVPLEPTREAAEGADLGITGAQLAVASTGSVLIPMGPGAPRVASLLPPAHLVVLGEDRIVLGFEELFDVLPDLGKDHAQTVLITGPSRTGDIELTLVRGVHGPMRVVVLVVAS